MNGLKIEIVKWNGEWHVEFWIGNQGFTLMYGGTKAEANWYKRMLQSAFKNLKKINK